MLRYLLSVFLMLNISVIFCGEREDDIEKMFTYTYKDQYNDLKTLLKKYEDDKNFINEKKFGATALTWATENDREKAVELLLSQPNIDINAKENILKKTALMNAVERKNAKIVELLLKHPKIDVNSQNQNGDTALMLAIYGESLEIIKLLLNHPNIDVNMQNNHNNAALKMAANIHSSQFVSLLLNHPNINVNLQDEYGNTPLMDAVIGNLRTSIIKLLLNHKDIDLTKVNKAGKTVFSFSTTDEIKSLLEQHKARSVDRFAQALSTMQ